MALKKVRAFYGRLWKRARRAVLERTMTETYSLVELESYAAGVNLAHRLLVSAGMSKTAPPIFLRDDDLCDISLYQGLCPAPEINLYEFANVTAVGRTEFVITNSKALYPRVIDPASDAFMLELENRGSVNLASREVSVFPRGAKVRVDKAISLLGQCNGNYAHWVTEVLARFVLIDDLAEYKGWPLLVDHPVHEKLLDALDFLNVSRREIINVLPYQKVEAGRLVYVTPPSMTPPDTRTFFETGKLAPPRVEQFHFSNVALAKLRERTVPMALDCLISPKLEEPWCELPAPKKQRIFLRRQAWATGNGRLLRNAEIIEQALEELQFTGTEIADFSFEGQVLTVQDVEIIVSPIGAALTNLVFREPGCIVIILTPHYAEATFFYFANLMAALGHELIFVLGPQTRHGGATVYNRDFRMSVRLLRVAVRKAIEMAHDRNRARRKAAEMVALQKEGAR